MLLEVEDPPVVEVWNGTARPDLDLLALDNLATRQEQAQAAQKMVSLAERELEILRRFKHEEILRIGVGQFSGDIDSPTARWLVTELAEVCLAAAVEIAAGADERWTPRHFSRSPGREAVAR